jgi:predicted nucleic acid-binding protein
MELQSTRKPRTSERLFLDTVFVQALLNRRDQYHPAAVSFLPRMRDAAEVWTTEAILVEIGNALGALDRRAAYRFIEQCYRTTNIHVVSVDTALLRRALQLYVDRKDKEWGLTDCISFVVMQEHELTDAITNDRHFTQAGYQAVLL